MGLFDFLRGLFGDDDDSDVGPAGREGERSDGDGGGVDEMLEDAPDLDEDATGGRGEGLEPPTSGSAPSDGASDGEGLDAPPSGTAPTDDAGDDEALEPPESFREEAEELVEFWPEHDLDYTPESLQRLDEFVDAQWDKDRFRNVERAGDGVHMDELVFEGVVVQLGSYFGETLVRTHDAAEWTNDDEFGWVVTVDGPEGELVSNVFHIAKDCLREPSKFAVSYDNVMAHSGVGEPILEDRGEAVTIEVSMPDEDADPAEFRAAADRLVEDYSWYDLDYTPGSLADLDDLVTAEIFDGESLVDAFESDELSETVEKLGSYLGETLVESHDGEWTYEDDTWTVDVERDGEVIAVEVFRAAVSALHEDTSFVAIHDRFTGGDLGTGAVEEDVAELAAAQAGTLAGEYDEYDLDFTPESLARLDELAASEFGQLADLEEPTDQLLEAAGPFSAYFGEVLRREHGAVWTEDEDGPAIYLETEDGGAVGLDAIRSAATCLAGNATFEGTYEELLAER